ncbi:hypothetical protein [Butyricimonas faecihominis]|uniref:hypothetical protein n=1 Tax=Butyricimonas faecihominis TaxID=1472416 RepID=UPI00266F0153|nr:hypothetical protein [Butyricimonas faecihominis]
MTKKQIVNGLTKDDIVLLYRYLDFYEKNQIKALTKNKDLNLLISNVVFQIKTLVKSVKFVKAKKGSIPLSLQTNNTVYYPQNDTMIPSLLRHFRNSIAHALVKKEGKVYYITDIGSNKNKILTFQAVVEVDIIEGIIKQLLR